MILELPKKFNSQFVSCTGKVLIIHQLMRYEDLMYNLTKAIRGKKCIYCGKILKNSNYTLDHRYPKGTGGVSITNNLFPCCDICNTRKGNLTHNEYLEVLKLSKKDRERVVKHIYEENDVIIKKIGFKLPSDWITFEDLGKIKYRDPKCYSKGKKYSVISEFYRVNHKLPRPIILDNDNMLLQGYNLLVFARENGISKVPVIKLENVRYMT